MEEHKKNIQEIRLKTLELELLILEETLRTGNQLTTEITKVNKKLDNLDSLSENRMTRILDGCLVNMDRFDELEYVFELEKKVTRSELISFDKRLDATDKKLSTLIQTLSGHI